MTILEQDIKEIKDNFDFSVFKNKTIMITGATGLIGKICTKSILNSDVNAKVIALVRNKEKADNLFGSDKNLEIIVQDIKTKIDYSGHIDYIIHCASVTASSDFVEKPVETINVALEGTRNVLDFAKNKNIISMIYLSSLEVYGVTDNENITEKDYGYIDILNPRSSYSEGKRLVETLCISYGCEYNIPVKIARLAQTFGSGVSKDDNRVFAQFVKSVINKENIILHTKGETKRNYCYTTDAVRAIFTILTKGENNNAYNIANKNTYISIADMAKSLENNNTKVIFEIDNKNRGYNPTVKIKLDTKKLENLGWKPIVNLDEMFERTIKSFNS